MRGEVLLSRVGQQVAADPMIAISSQGPARSLQNLLRIETIIECHKLPPFKSFSGSPPPFLCHRRFFPNEPVRQNPGEFCRPILGRGYWTRQSGPFKIAILERDSPFKPFLLPCIPSISMHRNRIQQFVRKDDSTNVPGLANVIQPPNSSEFRQHPTLPCCQHRGGFGDLILEPLK